MSDDPYWVELETTARELMKRCQTGFPRHLSHHDAIHSLLADCYGFIGKQDNAVRKLREALIKERAIRQSLEQEIQMITDSEMSEGEIGET